MGTTQNIAAGKRNPAIIAEGGETMTGAEVDAIKGAADAAAWEDANTYDTQIQQVVELLEFTTRMLEKAEKALRRAEEGVAEMRAEMDAISALGTAVEDIEFEIRTQIERIG